MAIFIILFLPLCPIRDTYQAHFGSAVVVRWANWYSLSLIDKIFWKITKGA